MAGENLDICYLVFVPNRKDLRDRNEVAIAKPPKEESPYFFELDIKFGAVEKKEWTIDGTKVIANMQLLDNQVWVTQFDLEFADAYARGAVARLESLREEIRRRCWEYFGLEKDEIYEEYTVLKIDSRRQSLDEVFRRRAFAFARLLKGVDKELGREQAASVLSARLKFSDREMTVVDWDGAVVASDDGDFQSDIDLMKVGNYQLIRYRLLDQKLDENLNKIKEIVESKKQVWWKKDRDVLADIVNQNLSVVLDFEKIDQSILLIGDWYSAQLYRIISQELYVNEWKGVVKNKLVSLESIHATVSDRFSFSWNRLLDQVQLVGWMLLLVGYGVLFVIDMGWW